MKRMLRSKEGISPILATLLLIVIAVAAVIVTYAWVMTFTSSQTGQAGVILKKDVDCLWKTGNVTIYVRNTGTSDAEINAVYINEEPKTATYSPSAIVAKDGGLVTITVTFSWSPSTDYRFQISPKAGSALSFTERSPSA